MGIFRKPSGKKKIKVVKAPQINFLVMGSKSGGKTAFITGVKAYMDINTENCHNVTYAGNTLKCRYRDFDLTLEELDSEMSMPSDKEWKANMTIIIYVVDMSAYEDAEKFQAQLKKFSSVCDDKDFEKTMMVLNFNKKDIFLEKIKEKPIESIYPKATDPTEYIRQRYQEANYNLVVRRDIVGCESNILDKENLVDVWRMCRDMAIRHDLSIRTNLK